MKTAFLSAFLITFSYIAYNAVNAEYYTSQPEPGITCLQVDTIYGNRAPAGCFTGDITQPGNEFSSIATAKYQR